MLWVIGIALILTGVPVYVILPAYAILFAAAIPFVRVRTATLWIGAAVVALVVPWLLPLIEAAPFWEKPPTGRESALPSEQLKRKQIDERESHPRSS